MKYATALLVAGSMFAVASPAMAQDAESAFTGFRVGVTAGYDVLKAGSDVDDDSNPDNNDQSIEGVAYGVTAGYDFDLGGAVVGLEGEYTDSTAKTEFDEGDFEGFGFGRVDAGRDLYLGARVGAKVAPDVLAYVKGGYTNAGLNILRNDGETETRSDIDLDGWRAGAGVEYAINQNTFFNVEYRYSNYNEGEIDLGFDDVDGQRVGVDVDRHQLMAGVGMRF